MQNRFAAGFFLGLAVMGGMLYSSVASASTQGQTFDSTPDQLLAAAECAARIDRRVSQVHTDEQVLEFRVQVDSARPVQPLSEMFYGIYVQATVQTIGANKSRLALELKRVYPVAFSADRSTVRTPESEEAVFARGYFRKVKTELQRTQSQDKHSSCSTGTGPAPASTSAR